MTVSVAPVPFQYLPNPNNTGQPAAGFRLFTYVAGTTTKQSTWVDSTQTVQNANPIPLDANGFIAAASGDGFWLDPTLSYKLVLAPPGTDDPPTSPIRSLDNVQGYFTLASLTAVLIGSILYPRTASEIAASVTPVNYQYPPGWIDRYGTNTTPGTTDMSTALSNAIASNNNIYAFNTTYSFASTAGFVFKGQRIYGAGRHATVFQIYNTAASTNSFSFQSISTGYDTSAPGASGFQLLGNGNTNAAANGIALISSDGSGCHGGYFSDIIVGGFNGTGSTGWLLSGKQSNGIYDNVFINCFSGPTSSNSAWVNQVGWTLTTSDAPGQPNRCNNNNWYGGGAVFCTGDGLYINYASENSFSGFDREQNGGYGVNIQGVCPSVDFYAGDSENNTSGSFNKANSSSSVGVYGGNITEAPAGSFNRFDKWFPNGTQAGKWGVDNSGNVTEAGTTHTYNGTNPVEVAASANFRGFDTTNGLNRMYRGLRMDSVVKTSSSGALSLAGVTASIVEVVLFESITSITMPTAVDGYLLIIQIKQAGGGGFTVSGWPVSVHWAGGSAPTMTATGNKIDKYFLRYNSDQAIWTDEGVRQNM